MELILDLGWECFGDRELTDFTVGELRQAVTKRREVLEEILAILSSLDPDSQLSTELVSEIQRIFPDLNWKRTDT